MSSRNLFILLTLLFIIVIFETGYYIIKTNNVEEKTNKTSTVNQELRSTSSFLDNDKQPSLKITFQTNINDKTGRTVFYEVRKTKNALNGYGKFEATYKEARDVWLIIGEFVKWEDIEGAKDKYIIIKNPKSNDILVKARVAFEESSLFDGNKKATSLGVENLDINNKQGQDYDKLGLLLSWTDDNINKIIKQGDVVAVHLLFMSQTDNLTQGIKKDEKGYPLVSWLTLRRFGGKQQIDREISIP